MTQTETNELQGENLRLKRGLAVKDEVIRQWQSVALALANRCRVVVTKGQPMPLSEYQEAALAAAEDLK